MLKLLNLKTSHLNKNLVNNILKLKDTHWKKGLVSQKEFFDKNVKKNDHHFLMYYKQVFVGYVLLRKEKCVYKMQNIQYFHFDTLIINKKYRKLNLSSFLMDFIKNFINHERSFSILFCNKKVVKYYEKFGWKKLNEKKFKLKITKPKEKKVLHITSSKITL
ncbi:GNAT family N-acetyltransferase [Candidatus Pelagibacter sp.]|uniref:GNAT family N-acetyltransferase n=1 Tax=Candidatus Pelagibacter sp. TaxID=2024849 RepID=UPI003F87FCDB